MSVASTPLRFSKMHGAGNDFVVLDRRVSGEPLTADLVTELCDRHRGVGCDQLLSIETPRSPDAAFAYGIWNADGSLARQCGNGARCVIAWAQRAGMVGAGQFAVDSPSGLIQAEIASDGTISVTLAAPRFEPESVGLDMPAAENYGAEVNGKPVTFSVVSLGNPHAVIALPSVAGADTSIALALQCSGLFADSCNVGFAEVVDRRHLRLRVVERGVGETLACGSGACAAVAVLRRAGELDADVAVALPGGTLQIHWSGEGSSIRMSGPTRFVFEGEWLA